MTNRSHFIKKTEKELISLKGQVGHLTDQFLHKQINGETYQELRKEVEAKIYHTGRNLRDMGAEQTPLKKYLFEDIRTLEYIVDFYQQSTGVLKKRILSCMFSEKIQFDEKKDTTIKFTKPVELMFQIFNELENPETKKEVEFDLFNQFAPLIYNSSNYHPLTEYVILYKTQFQS